MRNRQAVEAAHRAFCEAATPLIKLLKVQGQRTTGPSLTELTRRFSNLSPEGDRS